MDLLYAGISIAAGMRYRRKHGESGLNRGKLQLVGTIKINTLITDNLSCRQQYNKMLAKPLKHSRNFILLNQKLVGNRATLRTFT